MNKIILPVICSVIVLLCTPDLKAQSGKQKQRRVIDQSGRTGMLIFSGYYSWWLAMVSHEAWDVNLKIKGKKGKSIPLMPLIVTPAALLTTHFITKNREITHAQTSIITLGAHYGTWQGLGWSAVADMKTKSRLNTGTFAGLGGIGAGMLLSKYVKFSEGGATLTHSGMFWGGWFGLLSGLLLGHEDDELLTDMLVGSNIFLLTAGIALRQSDLSRNDVYRMNAIGYAMGGVAWLIYVGIVGQSKEWKYDSDTAIAVLCMGSIVGLVAAYIRAEEGGYAYRQSDSDITWSISPQLQYHKSSGHKDSLIPGMCLNLSF